MATQPIDYAALAKQAGAVSSTPPGVDYAALAKQAGAISSTAAPVQQQPQQGFFSSLAHGLGIPEYAASMQQFQKEHPILSAVLGPAVGGVPIAKGMIQQALSSAKETQAAADAIGHGSVAGEVLHLTRAIPMVGPALDKAADQYADKNYAGEAGTLLAPAVAIAGPKLLDAGVAAVRNAPAAVRTAVAGSNLDTPIPGEPVTPQQQFQIAKDQGVTLDAAQATGSPLLRWVKKVTDSSLGGGAAYWKNFAQNLNALQMHAQDLLNQASPADMSREQFGNVARTKLLQDQAAQNATAGALYDDLTERVGDQQPLTQGIKQQAKAIVDENDAYYAKHPDMLKGGAARAWSIVKNLAEGPDPASAKPAPAPNAQFDPTAPVRNGAPAAAPVVDTWSDLHKLRSDLMDITRGPDFIGDRPTGWIKQMTSSVDKAMTDGASGLSGDDLQAWRDANDIYQGMKQTYDNPQSLLYHVVRSPDGLTAANTLSRATPAVVRQIGEAAPDLVPQMQRQTISRLLNPAGDDVPDLKNLPSRFTRTQKEQLGGVLTPSQMVQLENLARTSRIVHATDNASGTAIKGQAVGEASAIGAGLLKSGVSLLQGDPAGVAEGLAPVGWYGATRAASRAMTSPAVVERLMQTPAPRAGVTPVGDAPVAAATGTAIAARGQDRWAQLGAAKLADHVAREANSPISAADVDALSSTPQGKQLLIQASDLEPGSTAMRNLVKQIQAQKQ